jgi:DNA-binding NarL/FixJ family response regulator
MISVAMVEDHPIVRAGLAQIVAGLPDVTLVAAVDRIEALPQLSPPPDVVLFDLRLPSPLQGLAGVRFLAEAGHKVLVVTGNDTGIEEVADAVAAGAGGYLTKQASAEEYAVAIRVVAAGRGYVGARLKVDRELAARVEARLAEAARTAPRRQHSRRPMLRGAVIGACAGALATTLAFALPALHVGSAGTDRSVPSKVFVPFNNVKGLPQRAILMPAIKPVPAPPAKRPT